MLDIKFIRENAEKVQQNTLNKGYKADIKLLLDLDANRKKLQQEVDDLREQRNTIVAKTKGSKPSIEVINEGKVIRQKLVQIEADFKEVDDKFNQLLKQVPNMSLDNIPVGNSEDDNKVIKTVGEPPKFDFQPKNHIEIAAQHGWIDKERAAKVTGSRFAYIMGDLVKLQLAILQFAMDTLTNEAIIKEIIETNQLDISTKPFQPVLPPLMIKTDMYDAMDRLEPREERYKIEGDDLWLQGSAEHVLGSIYANEIINEVDLPIRYIGYAPSFRREAGSYGSDMEGIMRMHQFDKIEMESFSSSKNSLNEHKLFIAIQEYLLSKLGLPYQVVQKCTFDIGKPNASGVDMEVWLPGQNRYRETHSADYMTDYQARRLNTRVRQADGKLELAHTNDATVFAMGRTMIAILENNQTADGRVMVPEVLKQYLGQRDTL